MALLPRQIHVLDPARTLLVALKFELPLDPGGHAASVLGLLFVARQHCALSFDTPCGIACVLLRVQMGGASRGERACPIGRERRRQAVRRLQRVAPLRDMGVEARTKRLFACVAALMELNDSHGIQARAFQLQSTQVGDLSCRFKLAAFFHE
ncbi:hypothetical protein F6X37_24350 [Paraburkholderia sp. 31.1]|uniref:hypothetical protein n=1 Tax=Paraburkholderia sp. 31.1 TaxID=2615205 RepID=UPI00165664C9|nr:hypothetical protein [Paraburkholderia sp. 31.1]MBC8724604.1 hypothetical protein [Paraburkholderia sp. 31.1]